jgi:hypothetical protein
MTKISNWQRLPKKLPLQWQAPCWHSPAFLHLPSHEAFETAAGQPRVPLILIVESKEGGT